MVLRSTYINDIEQRWNNSYYFERKLFKYSKVFPPENTAPLLIRLYFSFFEPSSKVLLKSKIDTLWSDKRIANQFLYFFPLKRHNPLSIEWILYQFGYHHILEKINGGHFYFRDRLFFQENDPKPYHYKNQIIHLLA